MKLKVKILTISALVTIIASIAVSFVFGYYFYNKEVEFEALIGNVFVVNPIFFENNPNTDPNEVETGTGFYKKGVYEINISNADNESHVNKLRIDFKIESNIHTYLRVRVLDSLTIVYKNSAGQTVELPLPVEDMMEYEISSGWYYDEVDDWFYYTNKLIGVDEDLVPINNTINFIIEGINYPLQHRDMKIQLGLVVQAVQAYRGPQENWGLAKNPWNEGDW